MICCEKCDGTGKIDEYCAHCGGHGVVYMPLEDICIECDGDGKAKCRTCDGRGFFENYSEYMGREKD